MKTYQQEAYSQPHSRLWDSDQSHLLDTFQSFEQYHDLSIYSVHGLIHITFLLLALSNQTDSGCPRVRHLSQVQIQIINYSKNELIVLLLLYLITVQRSNYKQNNLIFTDLLLVYDWVYFHASKTKEDKSCFPSLLTRSWRQLGNCMIFSQPQKGKGLYGKEL